MQSDLDLHCPQKLLMSSSVRKELTELQIIFGLNAFLPPKISANADFELFDAENKTYEVKVFSIIVKTAESATYF